MNMHNTTRHTLTRTLLLAGLVTLPMLTACRSGPGRCVGAETAQAAPDKVLLNLDRNGVAVEGYDPVAFFTDSKPVKGDPAIRATHQGAVYHFATTAHRDTFVADPDKYAPQFGGWCAYAAAIDTLSPISPDYWQIVDGRLLLQHNQRAWDKWHEDPANNLVKADKNWPGLVERNGAPARAFLNVDDSGLALEGYDPTAYFIDGKPIKGDPALARTYQGATYYFVDKAHKDAFEKEPAKYVPQFGGFCAYAAAINRVSPVNPEIWQIVDGRLALQHTPEAYRLFNEDVPGNYAKAGKNWPGLAHRRCK